MVNEGFILSLLIGSITFVLLFICSSSPPLFKMYIVSRLYNFLLNELLHDRFRHPRRSTEKNFYPFMICFIISIKPCYCPLDQLQVYSTFSLYKLTLVFITIGLMGSCTVHKLHRAGPDYLLQVSLVDVEKEDLSLSLQSKATQLLTFYSSHPLVWFHSHAIVESWRIED